VDYLHESALEIYRRRRRQRTVLTMTCVALLLGATVVYAGSYVQGWVSPAPKAVANASCSGAALHRALRPGDVTINVYNSTARTGLAASAASSLQGQGFNVATIDNDPLGKTLLGVGEIRYGQSGSEGALLASKRLPGSKLVLDDRMDASVDMVVGKLFEGVKVPPKVAPSKNEVVSAPGC
jgi:hypothetical protein